MYSGFVSTAYLLKQQRIWGALNMCLKPLSHSLFDAILVPEYTSVTFPQTHLNKRLYEWVTRVAEQRDKTDVWKTCYVCSY